MNNVDMMPDASEVVHYDRPEVPIYIREGRLSFYPNMRALGHWHDDFEWIYIQDGEMNYDINGEKILLRPGNSLWVNSRQMHYGYSEHLRECYFLCFLFHPQLLNSSRRLYQDFVLPVLNNDALPYLLYDEEDPLGNTVANRLKTIMQKKNQASASQLDPLAATGASAFEMEITGLFWMLWGDIYRQHLACSKEARDMNTDLEISRAMVSFINLHFADKITLADIAAAGNVSRSKCCAIFAHYLKQPPNDFLNTYRLKVSAGLLTNTQNSITEIALSCGFNHLSYFSKQFARYFGCTPKEYRRQFCSE